MALAQDDEPVQTLSSQGAPYPLAGGVRTRAAKRDSGDPDASDREDRVEVGAVLRVPVADQHRDRDLQLFQLPGQVARLLRHPGRIGICGGVAEDDPARADLKEDEHVQDTQPNAVDGQEIAGQNGPGMSSEELGPGRARAPRRRAESMTAKDLADRGVGDSM